jgi:uncharacterized protein (TIGR00251 family)
MSFTIGVVVDDLFDVSGDDAIVLRLHVQPGAGRTAVVGVHGDALKVRVAAAPEGGRANAAVLNLVATTIGVKEDAVELTSGQSSRSKRVKVSGVDVDEVRRLLTEAIHAGSDAAGGGNVGNNRRPRDVRPRAR